MNEDLSSFTIIIQLALRDKAINKDDQRIILKWLREERLKREEALKENDKK